MKKRHGLDRAIAPIPLSELQALNTGALIARLNRLRHCEETSDRSDLSENEIRSAQGMILFKSDTEWKRAYRAVKGILAEREHLANKPR